MNKTLLYIALACITALPAGHVLGQADKAGEIQIEGSTTVGPIVDAFKEAFSKTHPDVMITVKKTGSGDGARALVDGKCDIAAMSRFMKPGEFKDAVDKGIMPVAHVIAMDAVCVIVHPSNPVKKLSLDQIRDIYTGKVSNWKDVGGPDKDIVLYTRDSSSGTYEVFHKIAMNKEKMAGNTQTVSSNQNMKINVANNDAAIGYAGLGYVDESVKAVLVNDIEATEQNVAAGKYPISRPLYLFTNGYPKLGSSVHAFCTFYLKPDGQDIIKDKGFIPVTVY